MKGMNSIKFVEIVYSLHIFGLVNMIKTEMTNQNIFNKDLSQSILRMNYNEIFLFLIFF
jgi:hypothetical protein